nr:stage II sporulation protein M [uncultured Capnocytophaga sp.]
MREVAFIKQNKDKWLEVETVLNERKPISPDQMADYYVQLLGDLSFVQTYYPKSNTTIYLNFLVTQIYQKIYKTKRIEKNRLKFFFTDYIPMLAYKYRKLIYFSFILFFFFALVGALSAYYEPRYVRAIMGDMYVNMTLENIENGDPMAVYKQGSNWASAIEITFNNVKVAFYCFLFGITAGVMTFSTALQNGVILGAFMYFCYEMGEINAALRALWLHGAMEIFSIVIAIAAGFVLTGGILFPKTYSRMLSFKIAFREGVSLLFGTVPFFIAAGFIEGFITRYYYDMPLWLNLTIILGTLAVITYYFLIYPVIKNYKSNS